MSEGICPRQAPRGSPISLSSPAGRAASLLSSPPPSPSFPRFPCPSPARSPGSCFPSFSRSFPWFLCRPPRSPLPSPPRPPPSSPRPPPPFPLPSLPFPPRPFGRLPPPRSRRRCLSRLPPPPPSSPPPVFFFPRLLPPASFLLLFPALWSRRCPRPTPPVSRCLRPLLTPDPTIPSTSGFAPTPPPVPPSSLFFHAHVPPFHPSFSPSIAATSWHLDLVAHYLGNIQREFTHSNYGFAKIINLTTI